MAEWIETIAIVLASGTAVWGITQWRRQMIAERKMELGEKVLSAFYEAKDVIRAARSPMSVGGEGRGWRNADEQGDNRPELSRVDAYFAPAERLYKEKEFFAKFRALQYRFRAVFGVEAQKNFEAIWDARHTVIISSTELAQATRERMNGAEDLDPETRKGHCRRHCRLLAYHQSPEHQSPKPPVHQNQQTAQPRAQNHAPRHKSMTPLPATPPSNIRDVPPC